MKKFVVLELVFLSGMLWGVSGLAGGRSDVRGAATATFAGGCFWCVEADFEKLPGVLEVVSGYTGGTRKNPTYKQVSAGGTGHVEAVRVFYDAGKISYPELVEYFWRHVDPTDSKGQFADRGPQYRPVVFYENEEQKKAAELSMKLLDESSRFDSPVATQILPAGKFYEAEDYHQDYYKKNPIRYRFYRYNSGRDRFLDRTWSKEEMTKLNSEEEPQQAGAQAYEKPSDELLRKKLTPLQYQVTQKEGTEPPFNNDYWNNKADGIYVDVVSGEPLFSSIDKFESGTGWPSFTRPLEPANIVEKVDRGFFMTRTEVRSRQGDSHLGHVFPDGPAPTRQRYCMNSAAMRFVPKEDLMKEGYGQYLSLFGKD